MANGERRAKSEQGKVKFDVGFQEIGTLDKRHSPNIDGSRDAEGSNPIPNLTRHVKIDLDSAKPKSELTS